MVVDRLQKLLRAGAASHETAAREAQELVSSAQRAGAALTAVVSVLALALLLLFVRVLQRQRAALDAESCDRLMASGCESAQGYHFSRAMPATAIEDWLARQGSGAVVR